MTVVTMPQMGESVVEGTLERWLVREGERVAKDQNLCEITTDKVDTEIPAPEAGVVTQLLVAEGQTIEVGAKLAVISTEAGAGVAAPGEVATQPAAPAEIAAPPPAEAPARATPLARRIAEDRGIDLGGLSGTGVGGRVTKADVLRPERESEAAAPTPPAPAPAASAAPGTLGEFLGGMRIPQYVPREGDKVIPFTGIRRRIAEHMVVSKTVSPHVGTVAEVDLNRLVRLRDRAKAEFRSSQGIGLTYLPFVVHATVGALKDVPRMNASVVDESIVEHRGIHIGVAVETERGLLVPVVRDADRLSLTGLAHAIEDLARRARDRDITVDELQRGTFTVSNPGREGNLYGFAVINQPQVGILRMGEIKKRPIVVERDGEESLAIHPMMFLALSYDHRIIDGVTGNGFLYRVARQLEAAEFEL
ncbi:MAG: dihydrolipoamide acetyltransferase family protein [Myxococcota bacterium]